jgi:spore cortex formation protein SpoVR/YcgB (stage V sporulation)
MDFADDAPMSAAEAAGTITNALQQMGYASIEAFADAIAAMDEESRNAEVRRLGRLLEGAE